MAKLKFIVLAIAAWGFAASGQASWQEGLSPQPVTNLMLVAPAVTQLAQNREISADEAARLVQRRTGGKVLRVKSKDSYFQVKVLLPSGVVKSYSVNKITGVMS